MPDFLRRIRRCSRRRLYRLRGRDLTVALAAARPSLSLGFEHIIRAQLRALKAGGIVAFPRRALMSQYNLRAQPARPD